MKDHSVEDLFRMKTIRDVTISPDAKNVAFIASSSHKDFKEAIESRVFLKNLAENVTEAISEDGLSVTSVAFSPDSSRISYVLSEKERNYIVVRDLAACTEERSFVRGKVPLLKWADNSSMVVLMEDYHEDEKKKKKEGNDGYFFEEHHKFQSLWKYTPGRGLKRITEGFQVWDFSLYGNSAVAITSDLPYNWSWYYAVISIINLETGFPEIIYRPERRQLSSPVFSNDGKKIYFIESLMSDNGVESGDIISCDLDGRGVSNLTENMGKSFSCFDISGDNLHGLANNMGTFELLSLNDGRVLWSSYGTVLPAFSPKYSHQRDLFALAYTSKTQRPEVLLIQPNGDSRAITDVNVSLSDLKSYDSKPVTWKSADGLEIYGVFRKSGDNAPLVVIVHGGPTSSSTENFLDLSTLLLSSGFSVFLPNYRGSTGKGRKYAEMNRGDMGGMDFTDIMAGVEYIIDHEKVNGERVYITGGSYGGFMSAWAVTQTDRFRASVSLFGISDWISFHGVSSIGKWDSVHYDQDPYLFDKFMKFSAIKYLDNVKTPILLMHGIEDPFVPVGQYYQMYRALKDKGKDARLLLFPREGHGFREKKHFQMYLSEMIKWFDKFN